MWEEFWLSDVWTLFSSAFRQEKQVFHQRSLQIDQLIKEQIVGNHLIDDESNKILYYISYLLTILKKPDLRPRLSKNKKEEYDEMRVDKNNWHCN